MGKFIKIKKIIAVCTIIAVIISCSQIFFGCDANTKSEKYQLIRIHIRADNNTSEAQAIKIKVRDAVTKYLTDALTGVLNRQQAYDMINVRLTAIEAVANGVLSSNGFYYTSSAKMCNEYFPARTYDGAVVESGYYDALILELGSGGGDNWWCVIYPPLCYVEGGGTGDVKYKSWLAEVYKKFFG